MVNPVTKFLSVKRKVDLVKVTQNIRSGVKNTHNTNECRKKTSAKSVNNDDEHFCFKISSQFDESRPNHDVCSLLVDTGGTTHIIIDKSKFVRFDEDFDANEHIIELADGTKTNNIVLGKGDAIVTLHDKAGVERSVTLNNALYIPTFKQNIFSVHAVVENGAVINFYAKSAVRKKANSNVSFRINKKGKLYFLNSVSFHKAHTLEIWHKILGHCNVRDT